MLVSTRDDYSRTVDAMPLVVDLDGTLINSDLLVESAFGLLGTSPLRLAVLLPALMQGPAAIKSRIAAEIRIDPVLLPYNEAVLTLIRDARAAGRPVYLASASTEVYVADVAAHLGLFTGWFASTASENLSGAAKAQRLVAAFGSGRFDYIGNSTQDLPIWQVARYRLGVNLSAAVRTRLLRLDPAAILVTPAADPWRAWIKLMRVHQWAKNLLVVIPLVTAQHFDLRSLGAIVAAFFAFSLAASSIYIVNDLVDLDADRRHPSKKRRPLAAGTVPILSALAASPAMLALAFVIAIAIAPRFAAVLLGYLVLTTAYTLILKRKIMIDVVTLAGLYTVRVLGGAAAIAVPVSEWLLGFSMFIFTALALIKRYVELASRLDAGLSDPTDRDYRKGDLDIVAALAAASGFNAVTIFALYVSSTQVHQLYRHPQGLWLICPILTYWLGRALLLAHRRMIDDDPVVFALTDRNSLIVCGLIGAILVWSI